MNTKVLSWNDIDRACQALAKQIRDRSPGINVIVPVVRGGLVPGTILSHILDIPVGFVCSPGQSVAGVDERDSIVVVDDVCDTGITFGRLRPRFPNALFAALYAKPAGERMSLWTELFQQDVWLRFPWERG